jgi:hypothetical protein
MGFHHRVTSDGQWWSKQRAGSETTTNSQKMEAPRGPRPSCRGCTGERRRESEVGYGHLTTGVATGRHIPVR